MAAAVSGSGRGRATEQAPHSGVGGGVRGIGEARGGKQGRPRVPPRSLAGWPWRRGTGLGLEPGRRQPDRDEGTEPF